ncbi:methyl-accepting chemotaxis protein [Breznakibacter xylanolyticus]|nr:HAMP domain-containing methyl-accepting chemotaxis protein [Breznakibacter xylanolyticus]
MIKHLSFRIKLILAFLIVALFFIGSSAYNLWVLNKNHQSLNQINQEEIPEVIYASQLQVTWLKARYQLVQFVDLRDENKLHKGFELIDSTNEIILKCFEIAESSEHKEELTKKYSHLAQLIKDYRFLFQRYVDFSNNLINNGEVNKSRESIHAHPQVADLFDQIISASEQIDQNTQSIAIQALEDTKNSNIETESSMIGAVSVLWSTLIIAFAVGMLVSFLLSASLSKGINRSVTIAEAIAAGDLSHDVSHEDLSRGDEIGRLSKALDKMGKKLNETITGITESTLTIAHASREMSNASQRISTGANEQASSAEEVSSAMEEMAGSISQNAENANKTRHTTHQSTESITKGNRSVQETVEAMEQIGNKIKVINNIAAQTNILALNAAVEAARAGEHGKGFAVVAQEVRKLAELSKHAADDIMKVSAQGIRISQEAGVLLNTIVPDIQQSAELVEEIAASSLQQKSGSDQINYAIAQLSLITQQNAADAEEMAGTSQELSAQADQLRQMIAFFKTK